MEESGLFDFAAVFARLTCVFEDGAGVATAGQTAGLSVSRNKELAAELNVLHQQASDLLVGLSDALNR
ncbi:hypothetical protein AB3Y40_13600 [Yoonia sp. R2331]|uniref:hypothetical protein n=1 Tax=Yoonia sp. R2331 TaxID=3237238 RepID=UPI0034E3972B